MDYPELSLTTLSVVAFATGIALFLWALVGQPIKFWIIELPEIVSMPQRVLVVSMALVFASSGAYGFWHSLPEDTSAPTMTFFTGLSGEEAEVLGEIVAEFEQDHGVEVNLENVTGSVALDRLTAGEQVDLISFDINGRHELVRRGLIEDLTEEKFKGLVPSAVNPVLLEHLEVDGTRYFMPYRPNVQVVFLNKAKFEEIDMPSPRTWQDVLEAAKKFHGRDVEARVVIHGTDGDLPLTLLQLIRSAHGDPRDLLDPQTVEALEFMRQLYPFVFPKSSRVDWQTASGFFLTDSVYLIRNWAFSLSIMHEAGRDEDFEIYAGWSWSKGYSVFDPSNLLGGEFLALPINARHREKAVDLMRFLMSKEVQEQLVARLAWPPMRTDAMGNIQPWQAPYQAVLTEALLYAEPIPDYWGPEIEDIYMRMSREITEPGVDIQNILPKYQGEIDALEVHTGF